MKLLRLIVVVIFVGLAQVSLADPLVTCKSVTSSTTGTEILVSFEFGAYVNSTGAVCVARMDNCSELTSCAGLPLVADSAVSLNIRTDSRGRYCAILKSGSTPVTVCANPFGQD